MSATPIIDSLEVTYRVLLEVGEERVRQRAKWGEQNHEPAIWLAILTEEVGELAELIWNAHCADNLSQDITTRHMRTEALHVAAVAVQIIEYLDRTAK